MKKERKNCAENESMAARRKGKRDKTEIKCIFRFCCYIKRSIFKRNCSNSSRRHHRGACVQYRILISYSSRLSFSYSPCIIFYNLPFHIPLNDFQSVFDVPLALCRAESERKERELAVVKGGILIREESNNFSWAFKVSWRLSNHLKLIVKNLFSLMLIINLHWTHNHKPFGHSASTICLFVFFSPAFASDWLQKPIKEETNIWWFINSFRVRYEVIACYFFALRFFLSFNLLKLFKFSSLYSSSDALPVASRNILWFAFILREILSSECYAVFFSFFVITEF